MNEKTNLKLICTIVDAEYRNERNKTNLKLICTTVDDDEGSHDFLERRDGSDVLEMEGR